LYGHGERSRMWVLTMVLVTLIDTVGTLSVQTTQTLRIPLEYKQTLETCSQEGERIAEALMEAYPGARDTWFTCTLLNKVKGRQL
jgi:hypothetical protein